MQRTDATWAGAMQGQPSHAEVHVSQTPCMLCTHSMKETLQSKDHKAVCLVSSIPFPSKHP